MNSADKVKILYHVLGYNCRKYNRIFAYISGDKFVRKVVVKSLKTYTQV